MKTSCAITLSLALLAWPLSASAAAPLLKTIQEAKPATADGARQVVALFHAELLQPGEDISAEAQALCGRYLPTAVEGMTRGHVATCALRADAYESMATCHWLAGKTGDAKLELTGKLALLDCPAQGVDGVDRATRLASDWLWPEAMEAIVHKQSASLKKREGMVRSKKAAERNLGLLREARRRRRAIQRALGTHKAQGLLIMGTQAGSPAARAGLRPDDLLIMGGAAPIPGVRGLRALLKRTNPLPITLLREGKPIQRVWRGELEGLDAVPTPARLMAR